MALAFFLELDSPSFSAVIVGVSSELAEFGFGGGNAQVVVCPVSWFVDLACKFGAGEPPGT